MYVNDTNPTQLISLLCTAQRETFNVVAYDVYVIKLVEYGTD